MATTNESLALGILRERQIINKSINKNEINMANSIHKNTFLKKANLWFYWNSIVYSITHNPSTSGYRLNCILLYCKFCIM